MRRSNCAGAMQYVPELTWILFLRILDERDIKDNEEAEAIDADFSQTLEFPYRWRDWAAPDGDKRKELSEGTLGDFFKFVNGDLIPHLKALRDKPNATSRQKVISEIMTGIDRVRVDTEKNFCDILDKVHELSQDSVDTTHVFALSQVYESLLLKMGEKGNDGGQFFTPREVIRAMVKVIDPQIGETVFDPCCGTGGFLAQAYEYMAGVQNSKIKSPDQLETLRQRTFYGREKENLVLPITLANLVLHGIDEPHIWHGNTLTRKEAYGGLFYDAPPLFDVILTNPPFGGKEGKEAQTNYPYKTGATQVLFLQEVIQSLKPGKRCGIVIDEGVLFRTNEIAFVQTKRKLLDDCDVWCIVSLPGGVFTAAGAGVKTNLLFFNKGKPTEKIWYYDFSDIKVGKKTPFTIDRFDDFFRLLPMREDGEKSWTVDFVERRKQAAQKAEPLKKQAAAKEAKANQLKESLADLKKDRKKNEQGINDAEEAIRLLAKDARELYGKAEEIENAAYDLKAVNPNAKTDEDTRTPEQLLDLIEEKAKVVEKAMEILRGSIKKI